MYSRRTALALLAGALLAGPARAAPAVNGLNVILITYSGLPGYPDGMLEKSGKRWIERNSNGTNRYSVKEQTESKLQLWDSKRKVMVYINVKVGGRLSWVYKDSPVTPYGKITALAKG